MKRLIIFIQLSIFSSVIFAQIGMEIKATSEGQTQYRLRSNNGSEAFDIKMNNDGGLRFVANGTDEVMHMDDDSEHIGIGTQAHASINLYNRNLELSSDAKYGMWSEAGGGGSGSRYGVYGLATSSSGNRYGIIGVASTANGRWGVYSAGNFYHTGSFTSVSDARLKSNIKAMDSELDVVMSLKPKKYRFKQDIKGINLAKGPQYGFVAQELEKIIPELVDTNMHELTRESEQETSEKIEIKGINYLGLIPILTKAIQEQQEIIEKLESRIAKLENALAAMD